MAQEVRSVGEDGFVNLDFPLSSHTKNASGSTTLVARGVLSNQPVGFSIEVHPSWKESPIEGSDVVIYWGRVTIKSIGPASDNFITALAHLYNLPNPKRSMLAAIEVEAAGLNSDPRQLASKPVHMKLFFNSNASEEHYAEVFLNTDLPGRVVQFHEKDMDYREPLIRAFYAVA
ncbi:MAG: hypothetical protein WDO12_08910 [Pseudomonadota bacterium]